MLPAVTENDPVDTRGLRPDRRPLLYTVVANSALAIALLGTPYVRGHLRARGAAHAFGRFAACLYDGTANGAPGLAMPAGDEEHYASRALSTSRVFPASCVPRLEAIVAAPATFVFPAEKTAELDVSRAVAVVRRELAAATAARNAGAMRVARRPLQAVARLRAALSELADATDEEGLKERDAIHFTRAPVVVRPARVPLELGGAATIVLRALGDGAAVAALDARGISRVRVGAGHVALARVARAPGVRAIVIDDDGVTWAIFATSAERCTADASHCALRATGVAEFDPDETALPAPIWLAAHPFDDDAAGNVRPSRRRVDIVARDETGAAIWRRFAIGATTPRGAPPLLPAREAPFDAAVAAHDWAPRPSSARSLTVGDRRLTVSGDPAVRVLLQGPHGERLGPPIFPAACWDDGTGFCGEPYLDARNGRILLGARDGGDLLVVESTDAGTTWREMSGLR